jgi:diguanylate cyclase (GGDEF)-like protein
VGVSQPKWQSVWLGALWAIISCAALCSLTIAHGFLLTAIGDSAQCILLFSFLVSAGLNIHNQDRRARLFWMLVSCSAALWLSAQVLWTHSEVFLRREVPNPFVGDIILFLHLVPLMAAMAVRPDVDRGPQSRRLASLDFILLFSWWLYLYLFIVIPWQYVHLDEQAYGLSFDTLYFSEHLVVLAAVGLVWRGSTGKWRRIYSRLFLAACAYALSSVAAGLGIDFGRYYTGSIYDIPLLVSMQLFTGAALASFSSDRIESSTAQSKAHSWVSAVAIAVAGSLPLLALWDVLFSSAPMNVRSFRLLLTLAAIVLIGGLRSWRQYVLDGELDHANRDLREASFTDILTGVRNRRFLATTIDNDIRLVLRAYSPAETANRPRNRDLIFYLIDVDHFKFINDAFGHAQGDDLLVQIAARISSAIRYSDVLIRWGGEEFLVVSRNSNRDEAETLASRVLDSVGKEPLRLASGKSIRRTCSIGWAVFPWLPAEPEAMEYQEILRLADNALYEAKRAGRNRAIGRLAPHTKEAVEWLRNLHVKHKVDPPTRKVVTLGPREQSSEGVLQASELI